MCFLAGANSIFVGARLLTTDNPGRDNDDALLGDLKMRPMGTRSSQAPAQAAGSDDVAVKECSTVV
jgi:biotin synthase